MKKQLFLFALSLLISGSSLRAQTPVSSAINDITLPIYSEDGNNGVAVAYDPNRALYYTSYAGNASYPIEVFDAYGSSKYTGAIGADIRGMWYNPAAKRLEGILYDNTGGFFITLDMNGTPLNNNITAFSYGMDAQAVATYDAVKKQVIFVQSYEVYLFKANSRKAKKVKLQPATEGVQLVQTPLWTGVKGYELGLLEAGETVLYLFDIKSGKQSARIKLNDYYGTEPIYAFNISYCNNHVWLYDKGTRTWYGYQIFN